LSRLSPEMTALIGEELRGARPERLGDAVTALSSALRAMFIDPRPVQAAIAGAPASALVLWGDEDQLVTRITLEDLLRRRPDWELRVFEGYGHLLPVEMPDEYARTVGAWLGVDQP
ncbi:alpha/beta fold hydrolase, partial [Actinomadura adrarensis]